MEEWKQVGLLFKVCAKAVTDAIQHGVREGIIEHFNVSEILPFSNFITKAPLIFHSAFKNHSHLFPGVDKGSFTAAVLYLLDNELMEWNLD